MVQFTSMTLESEPERDRWISRMPPMKVSVHRCNEASTPANFLSLPFEIRLDIYEYVLGVFTSTQFEVSIDIDTYASSDTGQLILKCSKRPEFFSDLAILRSSKRIYREALPVLYGHCMFFPSADEHVIAMFFGKMSDLARSNIPRLYLRPRPQKIIRRAGPHATLSQVLRGPSWTTTCEKISVLFLALEELFIYLHPLYGYDLERGNEIDWIIRPLSRLWRTKKTLASVGNGSDNTMTYEMVELWDGLMEKADLEAEEYAACRNRIMENRENWANPYWVMKRSRLLES